MHAGSQARGGVGDTAMGFDIELVVLEGLVMPGDIVEKFFAELLSFLGLLPCEERTDARIARHPDDVQSLVGQRQPLFLIAIRHILACVENLGTGFSRPVEPLLDQVLAKLLLLLRFPVEADDLLPREADQRIAVAQNGPEM